MSDHTIGAGRGSIARWNAWCTSRFHLWLKSESLELNQLTGAAIGRFVYRPSKRTRENYSYHVRRYLDWLHQRQLIQSGAGFPSIVSGSPWSCRIQPSDFYRH